METPCKEWRQVKPRPSPGVSFVFVQCSEVIVQ